jgi:hypothetical protein
MKNFLDGEFKDKLTLSTAGVTASDFGARDPSSEVRDKLFVDTLLLPFDVCSVDEEFGAVF